MQFALVNGARSLAVRDVEAVCPQCRTPMTAKCGAIVVHHWAHLARECDPWWEPETDWHLSWKALMPPHQTEVTRAGHRADIVRGDGSVVELQHSAISPAEIAEREAAYGSMVWLFDGRGLVVQLTAEQRRRREAFGLFGSPGRMILSNRGTHYTFRWKHPRKHYASCRARVYIDLGDTGILRLVKLYLEEPPYGGWGYLQSRADFVAWLTAKAPKRAAPEAPGLGL